jgi:hypothetical protein
MDTQALLGVHGRGPRRWIRPTYRQNTTEKVNNASLGKFDTDFDRIGTSSVENQVAHITVFRKFNYLSISQCHKWRKKNRPETI